MKQLLDQIPINKPLYFKTLIFVAILMVTIFVVSIFGFDYELTQADPFGATVSSFLGAYLIHLMIWNPDESEEETED